MRNYVAFHSWDKRPKPWAGIASDAGHTWLWLALDGDSTACITVFLDLAECREIAREMIQAIEGALAESEGGAA